MINPEKIKSVQAKIKAALDLIEKEENVQISFGNCSYTPAYYKTGMTVTSQEKSEKVDNLFSSISKRLGFTQNIIGMTFTGSTCGEVTITDIKLKNHKYPIIGVTKDGKGFKFTSEQVKRYLGGDKIINRNANLDKLLGE
jgi:hypothetical protein